MPAYSIRVTDGRAITERRGNLFEVVACADSPDKAISDALMYAPQAIRDGRMLIEIRPLPIVQ